MMTKESEHVVGGAVAAIFTVVTILALLQGIFSEPKIQPEIGSVEYVYKAIENHKDRRPKLPAKYMRDYTIGYFSSLQTFCTSPENTETSPDQLYKEFWEFIKTNRRNDNLQRRKEFKKLNYDTVIVVWLEHKRFRCPTPPELASSLASSASSSSVVIRSKSE